MPKKILKAKQVEKLENTSFASILLPLQADMPCGSSATLCICIPSCEATCCPGACTSYCTGPSTGCNECTQTCTPTNDTCLAVSDVGVGVVIQV